MNGDVEPNPTGEEKRQLVGVADDDERALAGTDDVVHPLAELGARRDPAERGQQLGVTPWIVLRRRARKAQGGLCFGHQP